MLPPSPSRLGALALLLLTACSRPSPTGVSVDRSVREPSGLTHSSTHPEVWWTHGDSGTGNWLFAVDASGHRLARVRVKGAQNIDWEDLTHDDKGHLWLGDIGNNDSNRRDLRVYRIPEPDPVATTKAVRADFGLYFHYPEQERFGDKLANFDAESLFWWREQLWLLTKHRGDDRTRLYRFPSLEPAGRESLALEHVASYDLGPTITGARKPWSGQVSAAEISPDGAYLAMLSYEAVFIFATPASGEGAELFDQLVTRIEFDQATMRQVEAVAWKGDELIIVNEGRAVFEIAAPLEQTRYPAAP